MNSTPTITVLHKWHWREYDSLCGGRTKGRTRERTSDEKGPKIGRINDVVRTGKSGYDGMGGISDSLGLALLLFFLSALPLPAYKWWGLCCRPTTGCNRHTIQVCYMIPPPLS